MKANLQIFLMSFLALVMYQMTPGAAVACPDIKEEDIEPGTSLIFYFCSYNESDTRQSCTKNFILKFINKAASERNTIEELSGKVCKDDTINFEKKDLEKYRCKLGKEFQNISFVKLFENINDECFPWADNNKL